MTEERNGSDQDSSAVALRVLVYLPEGMADWEVGYLMSELRQREVTERAAAITVATATGGAVTSMGGLRVAPDAALADVADEPFDALVLCGGTSWFGDGVNGAALELAARRKRDGQLVAAICGAVDAMGGAGLLDDVDHTGNELAQLEKWPNYHGRARFAIEPHAVRGRTRAGGTIVTAGSWAPTDFAAAVMEELGALSRERAGLWLRFWKDRDVSGIYGLFGMDVPTS
ncbi:DJ-1/PfpI family protein [Sinomonas sp. ASV322]|uniref:DJ-1/PfpI family protein n=1 Tax=Sinomonas sp. ASV322 TaxID=3041920 RepID=UPI0027DD3245|nr:DJ-1/PfpI family protein [Sinomonas sp. ASV322]MDQ4502033.1 DJ-1/PfpI family protein [Sinomonas sp. ASV322]